MSDECSKSAKRVAYFMTGLNLIAGMANLILGIYRIDSVQIVGGIIPLFAGAVLLIGIIKENATLLLVYLIVETVLFALGTICGLLVMIVLVTVSSQVIEGPRHIYIGKTFVVDKYVAGLIAFAVLVVIIVSWIAHFLLYIYYDDVVNRNKEINRRSEDTAVRYNVMENSEATIDDSSVMFVTRSSPIV